MRRVVVTFWVVDMGDNKMNFFRTRYRVRMDGDEWVFVMYRRPWYWPWWIPVVQCSDLKKTLSLLPKGAIPE